VGRTGRAQHNKVKGEEEEIGRSGKKEGGRFMERTFPAEKKRQTFSLSSSFRDDKREVSGLRDRLPGEGVKCQ